MSLESQVAQLRFEVEELRAVVEVQGRLLRRLLSAADSQSEFELVPEVPLAGPSGRPAVPVTPERVASVPEHHSPGVPGDTSAESQQSALSHAAREDIAKEVGRFLRRALNREFLGTSGRDKNPLRNRVYIICRDYTGIDISPPLVVERFSEVSSRCKRGSDCGSSVFVGLPTRWEARAALVEAGLPTTNDGLAEDQAEQEEDEFEGEPLGLAVAAASPEDRALADESGITVKAWVGYLQGELVSLVDYPPSGETCDHAFVSGANQPALPLALALQRACQDAFAFVSATSGDQADLPSLRAPGAAAPSSAARARPNQSARLDRVESVLDSLQQTLGTLVSQLESPAVAVQPAIMQASSKAAGPGPNASLGSRSHGESAFKGKGTSMTDVPAAKPGALATRTAATANPLSESDAEVDEEAGGADVSGGNGVARAVTQLTRIVKTLAEKRTEPHTLEGLLDRAETGFDSGLVVGSSSSSAARSKAAALRALQRAVVQQPAALSSSILSAMEEDL
ncbi:Cdk10 [Symbiodinium sp. CCMP2592]|nr:Cdk10 [Symbiodinium sp. CCMP2592]